MFRENLQLPNAMMAFLGIQSFTHICGGKTLKIPGLSAENHEQFTNLLQNQLNKINSKNTQLSVSNKTYLGSGFVNKDIQQSWLIQPQNEEVSKESIIKSNNDEQPDTKIIELIVSPFSLKSMDSVKAVHSTIINDNGFEKIENSLLDEEGGTDLNIISFLNSPQFADLILKELSANNELPKSKFKLVIKVSSTDFENNSEALPIIFNSMDKNNLPVLLANIQLPKEMNESINLKSQLPDTDIVFENPHLRPVKFESLDLNNSVFGKTEINDIFIQLDNIFKKIDSILHTSEENLSVEIKAADIKEIKEIIGNSGLHQIEEKIYAFQNNKGNEVSITENEISNILKIVSFLKETANSDENSKLVLSSKNSKIVLMQPTHFKELSHDVSQNTDVNRNSEDKSNFVKSEYSNTKILNLDLILNNPAENNNKLSNNQESKNLVIDKTSLNKLLDKLEFKLPASTNSEQPASLKTNDKQAKPVEKNSSKINSLNVVLGKNVSLLPEKEILHHVKSDKFIEKISHLLEKLNVDEKQPVKIQISSKQENTENNTKTGYKLTILSKNDIVGLKQKPVLLKDSHGKTGLTNTRIEKTITTQIKDYKGVVKDNTVSDFSTKESAPAKTEIKQSASKNIKFTLSWNVINDNSSQAGKISQNINAEISPKSENKPRSFTNSIVQNKPEFFNIPVNEMQKGLGNDGFDKLVVNSDMSKNMINFKSDLLTQEPVVIQQTENKISPETRLTIQEKIAKLVDMQGIVKIDESSKLMPVRENISITKDNYSRINITSENKTAMAIVSKPVSENSKIIIEETSKIPVENSNDKNKQPANNINETNMKNTALKTSILLEDTSLNKKANVISGSQNSKNIETISKSDIRDKSVIFEFAKENSSSDLKEPVKHTQPVLNENEKQYKMSNISKDKSGIKTVKTNVFEPNIKLRENKVDLPKENLTKSETSKIKSNLYNSSNENNLKVIKTEIESPKVQNQVNRINTSNVKHGVSKNEIWVDKLDVEDKPIMVSSKIITNKQSTEKPVVETENKFEIKHDSLQNNFSNNKNSSRHSGNEQVAEKYDLGDNAVQKKSNEYSNRGEDFSKTMATKETEFVKKSTESLLNKEVNLPRPKQIINRVAEQIKLKFGQKQADISIKLQPESLGKLSINMQMIGKVVSLVLTAETKESKEILTKHAYSLKENLASQGIKVEKIEINTQTEKNNFHNNQNSNSAKQHQQQSHNSSRQYLAKENSNWLKDQEDIKEEILEEKELINLNQSLDVTV